MRTLSALVEKVYRLTGLTALELSGEHIANVMNKLSSRFGGRLGLDTAVLIVNHKRTLATVFGRSA